MYLDSKCVFIPTSSEPEAVLEAVASLVTVIYLCLSQVLLNCPRTKVNVKADGGITPLMAAVKMVNSFMVKQLLKKDSEVISTTDSEGRTAVHWAAMVDNYEALRMLISRGPDTIKDAQDSKVSCLVYVLLPVNTACCCMYLDGFILYDFSRGGNILWPF